MSSRFSDYIIQVNQSVSGRVNIIGVRLLPLTLLFIYGIIGVHAYVVLRGDLNKILVTIIAIPALFWIYHWVRLYFDRTSFRNYFTHVLAFGIAVMSAFAISFYNLLKAKNSILASPQTLSVVLSIATIWFAYTLLYSQRLCWKRAFPNHIRKGDISAENGVNILAPIGYDVPWQTNLEKRMNNGLLPIATSLFGSLGMIVGGFFKETTTEQVFLFSLFAVAMTIIIFAVSRFAWFDYYLRIYEKHIGHELTIRGLSRS